MLAVPAVAAAAGLARHHRGGGQRCDAGHVHGLHRHHPEAHRERQDRLAALGTELAPASPAMPARPAVPGSAGSRRSSAARRSRTRPSGALGNCCGLTWGVGPSDRPVRVRLVGRRLGRHHVGSQVRGGLQHYSSTRALPGYGFSFTAPATTSLQRLTVWVHAHHGTGQLTAKIGSVTKVDAGIPGDENHGRVFTIDFAGDGTSGQTMTVTYVLASAGSNPIAANVAIYAAALSPAADFTIAAVPGQPEHPAGRVRHQHHRCRAVGASAGTVALSATSSTRPDDDLSAASYALGRRLHPSLTVAAGAGVPPGSLHGHGDRHRWRTRPMPPRSPSSSPSPTSDHRFASYLQPPPGPPRREHDQHRARWFLHGHRRTDGVVLAALACLRRSRAANTCWAPPLHRR